MSIMQSLYQVITPIEKKGEEFSGGGRGGVPVPKVFGVVVVTVLPKVLVFAPNAPVPLPPPKAPVVPKAPVPAGFAPKSPTVFVGLVPKAVGWVVFWPNAPGVPNADVVFCWGWPNALVVGAVPKTPKRQG
jgi:hypothetical protein